MQQTNVYYRPIVVKKVVVVDGGCNNQRRTYCDCVLLDGTHRVWGNWQTASDGSRYFLAAQSQELSGFTETIDGPSAAAKLDYNLQLAGNKEQVENEAATLASNDSSLLNSPLAWGVAAVAFIVVMLLVPRVLRRSRRPAQHL